MSPRGNAARGPERTPASSLCPWIAFLGAASTVQVFSYGLTKELVVRGSEVIGVNGGISDDKKHNH